MARTRSIWWLKKDFRLHDNPALHAALASSERVVPLFLFEPLVLEAEETSAFHVHAWARALEALRARLAEAGGDVCVLHMDAVAAFERLHRVWPFDAIYSHEEIGSNLTYARDKAVADWCAGRGGAWHEHMQTAVFRPLHDRDNRARKWRAWMQQTPLARPDAGALAALRLPAPVASLPAREGRAVHHADFGFTLDQPDAVQPVSEAAARDTLDSFLEERGVGYSGGISSPNLAFTHGSRLSVHLAWGTITGRAVYQAVEQRLADLKASEAPEAGAWRRSLRSFLSRLHWRDHFIQRLESETDMEYHALNPAYEALDYRTDPDLLAAWYEGRTGFPLVDACMRCAHATGFLNFRMRALVTSAACHLLHLDWRALMYPMARIWADYEPGIHISQLQMQAGVVGINTLRIYNPAKQIADHDPEAVFVKRWVPELRPFTPEEIIGHQEAPVPAYTAPVVDYKASAKRMRDMYFAIRKAPGTYEVTQAVLERHGSRKPGRRARTGPPGSQP